MTMSGAGGEEGKISLWVKDPLDTAWYQFDFLGTAAEPGLLYNTSPQETITSHTTAVDANITKLSDTAASTSVSIQVTGGTNGTQSLVTCSIHTSAGNVYNDEKYIIIATRQSP